MVRVFVTYESEPDPARYDQHAELCRKVPGATFRHGKITRTLFGNELAYYAEFEFPDESRSRRCPRERWPRPARTRPRWAFRTPST